MLLIYILHPLRDRPRRIIDIPLLVFLVFMADGLALYAISAALVNLHPLQVVGVMFSAALLADLTGIVLAIVRLVRTKPVGLSARK